MDHVLLVEDSDTMGALLRKKLGKDLHAEVHWAQTLAEAETLIQQAMHPFVVALLDLNLPDAPNGEIVDLATSHDIPSIVFTGVEDGDVQSKIWSKGVADYVLKETVYSLDYVVKLMRRLIHNREITVLVVDDSPTIRRHICRLLRTHRYHVLEAGNGVEALEQLRNHTDVMLVITDYDMPKMDGIELVRQVRRMYGVDELSVIGVSAEDRSTLSSQFIKRGANDFLHKPFAIEEFYCRVTQNIELVERFRAIREASRRDHLTRLYNRAHLFEVGRDQFKSWKAHKTPGTVAILDVDHFKKVNDTCGHDAGDAVLKALASMMQAYFQDRALVARFGGEEFCVVVGDMTPKKARQMFERFRKNVETIPIAFQDRKIPITISIGVCPLILDSLEEMISAADQRLYEAKQQGRNRVEMVT